MALNKQEPHPESQSQISLSSSASYSGGGGGAEPRAGECALREAEPTKQGLTESNLRSQPPPGASATPHRGLPSSPGEREQTLGLEPMGRGAGRPGLNLGALQTVGRALRTPHRPLGLSQLTGWGCSPLR